MKCGIRVIGSRAQAFTEIDLRYATQLALAHIGFKFGAQVSAWRKALETVVAEGDSVEKASAIGRNGWACGVCTFINVPAVR